MRNPCLENFSNNQVIVGGQLLEVIFFSPFFEVISTFLHCNQQQHRKSVFLQLSFHFMSCMCICEHFTTCA